MMLKEVIPIINTLKYPKSLDFMYGTRYTRLSDKTKRYLFLDLLSIIDQTNDLSTYNMHKPLWQDTHEVSQGLEHDTLVNLTYTCMCQ